MKITADNYDLYKQFFAAVENHIFSDLATLPPETRPSAVLVSFEKKSMALGRRSLGMGIGDILEITQDWPPSKVGTVDSAMLAQGLPTLTAVRIEFSKKIASIMERGKVLSEKEYYALRNVVGGMAGIRQERAWAMLTAFELKQ